MNTETILRVVLAILGAPFVGALLVGMDRRLSARFQGRVGPPITQPFYDLLKLIAKRGDTTSRFQSACLFLYLASYVVSLVLLVLGQDLLVMLFVVAFGAIAFIIGGFSVKSPYSQLGTQREVMQLMVYEPLLIFYAVGIYLSTGSFKVGQLYEQNVPLLGSLPAFVLTMIMVMLIKLRKSPFDTAASSHHGHQEVVRGPLTEVAGPSLALVELTHWYEMSFLIWMVSLLWVPNILIGLGIGLLCLLATIVIDNISARMTWSWMLKIGWTVAVPLSIANLAYVFFRLPVGQ